MSFQERIRLIFDVDGKAGEAGIKSFSARIKEADGAVGKMKAGFGAATDFIRSHANALALGAGAALITWAIKGAQKLQELAKASIDLGKATALSTEEASRWIAVADDAGLSATDLQAAFGKVAKTLDTGAWSDYGIATRDAAGEARSTNDILLDTFDVLAKTTNETERARIGNELFGKGYSTLAPLVGQTRAEYERMLAAVSDGQVITAEEAAKAEKMRLAQDALSDAVDDFTMSLGGILAVGAPVIEFMAEFVGAVTDGYSAMTGQDQQSIAKPLSDFAKAANATGSTVVDLQQALFEMNREVWNAQDTMTRVAFAADGAEGEFRNLKDTFSAIADESPANGQKVLDYFQMLLDGAAAGHEAAQAQLDQYGMTADGLAELQAIQDQAAVSADGLAESTKANAAAQKEAADAFAALTAEVDKQLGRIGDLEGAQLALADQTDAYNALSKETRDILNDGTKSDTEKAAALRELRQAQIDLAGSIDDVARKTATESGEVEGSVGWYAAQKTALMQMREQYPWLVGDIDKYIAALNGIPEVKNTTITATYHGPVGGDKDTRAAAIKAGTGHASGGPVMPGVAYPVNERGAPEMFTGADGSQYLLPTAGGQVTPMAQSPHVNEIVTAQTPPTDTRPIVVQLVLGSKAIQEITVEQDRQRRGNR